MCRRMAPAVCVLGIVAESAGTVADEAGGRVVDRVVQAGGPICGARLAREMVWVENDVINIYLVVFLGRAHREDRWL